MTDVTNRTQATAYLYENDEGSRELVFDANGDRARRLIELGYTEMPLFPHRTANSTVPDGLADLIAKLRSRSRSVLLAGWQKGRKCPECDASADRPKCMWDMGPSCPRHDPDAYDESPYTSQPDALCQEAADALSALTHTKSDGSVHSADATCNDGLQVHVLREALEDVVDPLRYLKRDADERGCELGGMAYTIANDLNFVKTIAKRALSATPSVEPASNAMREAGKPLTRAVSYCDELNSLKPKADGSRYPVSDFILDSELRTLAAALSQSPDTVEQAVAAETEALEPDDLLPSYCRLLDALQGDNPDAIGDAFHASVEAVTKFGIIRASKDAGDA